MTFQLDTSGTVSQPENATQEYRTPWVWRDLDAFTQGYVEALLRGDVYHRDGIMIYDKVKPYDGRAFRFSDLAPETLATIIRDCERFEGEARIVGLWDNTVGQGGHFWIWRQSQTDKGFPPLTPALGDDGLIRFAA